MTSTRHRWPGRSERLPLVTCDNLAAVNDKSNQPAVYDWQTQALKLRGGGPDRLFTWWLVVTPGRR